MINCILGFVVWYLYCRHLLALVTTSGFTRVSGYRPALLGEESLCRSRLHCTVLCAQAHKCAGFIFLRLNDLCIAYAMDPTEEAVRLIAEAGSEVHIKGKYINQRRSCRIGTITNIYTVKPVCNDHLYNKIYCL